MLAFECTKVKGLTIYIPLLFTTRGIYERVNVKLVMGQPSDPVDNLLWAAAASTISSVLLTPSTATSTK